MATIHFEGWQRYSNTGHIYQRWAFREDYAPCGASEGDFLCDNDPSFEPRFRVNRWTAEEWVAVSEPADEQVEDLFVYGIAEWDPPLPLAPEFVQRLVSLDKIVNLAAGTLRLVAALTPRLKATTTAASDTRAAPQPRTKYLRLVHAGTYRNTAEGFRVWEFLVGCPQIPASRAVEGPAYVRVGDQLWEERNEGTPYRLKRGGREIGTPEHWQVREPLAGAPAWPDDEGRDSDATAAPDIAPDPAVHLLRYAIPYGPVDGGVVFGRPGPRGTRQWR